MDRALELAGERGAELVLANDPDADRLAVAVPGARRPMAGAARATRWACCSADHLLAHDADPEPTAGSSRARSSRRRCSGGSPPRTA